MKDDKESVINMSTHKGRDALMCLLNEAPLYFRAMRLGRANGKAKDFRIEFRHEKLNAKSMHNWSYIARYFRGRVKDADADCRDNGLPLAKYEKVSDKL